MAFWFVLFFIQISRSFRLVPISRLILYNQLTLTIFGRCEQYMHTIDSIIYMLGNEVDRCFFWLETRLFGHCELKQNGVHGYLKTNWLNLWLKLNGRNARIQKTYCSKDVIYFIWWASARKKYRVNRAEK